MTLDINQEKETSSMRLEVRLLVYSKTSREWLSDVASIIEERGGNYGHPYYNHRRISELWSAYLEYPITAAQVAICMALVKVSRLQETWDHDDSILDLAAYADIYRMVVEETKAHKDAGEML